MTESCSRIVADPRTAHSYLIPTPQFPPVWEDHEFPPCWSKTWLQGLVSLQDSSVPESGHSTSGTPETKMTWSRNHSKRMLDMLRELKEYFTILRNQDLRVICFCSITQVLTTDSSSNAGICGEATLPQTTTVSHTTQHAWEASTSIQLTRVR